MVFIIFIFHLRFVRLDKFFILLLIFFKLVRKNKNKKGLLKKIALKSVEYLRNVQIGHLYTDLKTAQSHSDTIRQIAMSTKIRLPRDIKRSYCKHCYSVFAPPVNCRVRLQKSKVVYYCSSCKKFTRIPYK